jgi:hypothetical protein
LIAQSSLQGLRRWTKLSSAYLAGAICGATVWK